MIDRASDFCKYSSDTDYRGIVNEESLITDDLFLATWTKQRARPPITSHLSPLTKE
jgi:hypothetical protein